MGLADIVGVCNALLRIHILKVFKEWPIDFEKVSLSLLSAVLLTLIGLNRFYLSDTSVKE